MLSFNLERYGRSLAGDIGREKGQVWYGIPGRADFSAQAILDGIKEIGIYNEEVIVWFQHEPAIWADNTKFTTMLKNLDMTKVVTFHTLHFQSSETPSGLRKYEYELLQSILPHVDAITVFTHGVYYAVTTAFPEHCEKVNILEHGIHSYPVISRLSRREAKEELNDFLLYESELDHQTKEALHRQRLLLDPNTTILGQTGFLCPLKQSESLYSARDYLQRAFPGKNIAAVRIGSPREDAHKTYADHLRKEQDGREKFLLETWLPHDILPLAQRAFDVNFYWPTDCTQSGLLAHALGAGAIIASRDIEGIGETLKESGGLMYTDLQHLLKMLIDLIQNPETGEQMEETALQYAARYSWKKQAWKHYALADHILHPTPLWLAPHSVWTTAAMNSP